MDKAKLTEAMKAEAGMSISAGARAIPICPWCAQPNNLKAQRDALLAVLQQMLPDWSNMRSGESPGNTEWRDDLVRRARAALKLAKGE